MKEFFEKIEPIFSKHQNEKHVEFEMRLGKINRGSFDTNVGQEIFEKVLRRLKKYTGWEKVSKTNDVAYYNGDIRLVIDDDTDDQRQIKKSKLQTFDCVLRGKPLDVRFSAATEVPNANDVEEFNFARKRQRESFVRKNMSIDMTVVNGNPHDLDSEEENVYQIEFEILDPTRVSDKNDLYNIVHKIQDVFNVCS